MVTPTSHFNLTQALVLVGSCLGDLDLEPGRKEMKEKDLFLNRKIRQKTISNLAHHSEKKLWREWFLL